MKRKPEIWTPEYAMSYPDRWNVWKDDDSECWHTQMPGWHVSKGWVVMATMKIHAEAIAWADRQAREE